MKNFYSPTLQEIAAIRCTALMWNDRTVMRLAKIISYDLWVRLEMMVIQNVMKLPVTESMKKIIRRLVKPISEEIYAYREYNSYILGEEFSKRSLNYLRWTTQGTIDRLSSAIALLLRDKTIDVLIRFKLACTYCMERVVANLRGKVSEIYIKDFNGCQVPMLLRQFHFTWFKETDSKQVKRLQIQKIDDKTVFCMPALIPNIVSTTYFFRKMTSAEKADCLVDRTVILAGTFDNAIKVYAMKQWYFEIIFYLLRAMNNEQRMELYGKCGRIILKGFCDWPLQSLFLTYSNEIVPFLTGEACHEILHYIVGKLRLCYWDHNYYSLFCNFWRQIPDHCTEYILNDFCGETGLLSKLLEISALQCILFLLAYTNNNLKTKVFSSHLVSALMNPSAKEWKIALTPTICLIYPRDVCEMYRNEFSEQQFDWLIREIYGDVGTTKQE